MTFLGAVLAVLKTVLTQQLQSTSGPLGLGFSSMALVRYIAPYAVVQALAFAWWTGEVGRLAAKMAVVSDPGPAGAAVAGLRWSAGGQVWVLNLLAASALNIASFDASRRCGALGMAVAGNLKQVVVLVLAARDVEYRRGNLDLVLGSLMTVAGGVWYAFASASVNPRRTPVLPAGSRRRRTPVLPAGSRRRTPVLPAGSRRVDEAEGEGAKSDSGVMIRAVNV
jgi:hypothetical protein